MDNTLLVRRHCRNVRILKRDGVDEHLFIDSFSLAKKNKKSSRDNAYCQIYILTEKWFACVVSIKSKSEVLLSIKQFGKKIGSPDAIISDNCREDKFKKDKKFFNIIRILLRVLEEGTLCANREELYIGILKKEFRKDMKEVYLPLEI